MLLLAQGNALGGAYALINTFGILRLSRQNATRPWRVTSFVIIFLFVTRFGAWHFCAVGSKMPNVSIAACVTQGVALGYGQHLGLQPAPIVLGRVPLWRQL